MRAGLANTDGSSITSALGWWELAGVDTLVEDAPRNWFQAPAAEAPVASPRAAPPAESRFPEDLEGLVRWILDPSNLPALGPARVAPAGSAATRLMILTDMPDAEDHPADALLSGSYGNLFVRMLAAIGLARDDVYLASLVPAHQPGGLIDSATEAELGEIARRHIALAKPKALLLLGDTTTRALIGTNLPQARGVKHDLNLKGGTTQAVATFHPRFLLTQPARKADAWADLRLFLELSEK